MCIRDRDKDIVRLRKEASELRPLGIFNGQLGASLLVGFVPAFADQSLHVRGQDPSLGLDMFWEVEHDETGITADGAYLDGPKLDRMLKSAVRWEKLGELELTLMRNIPLGRSDGHQGFAF